MERVSYWTLDLTVVRARTKVRQDFISKSDLYVRLCLPTASTVTRRTRTISNKQNPEWNETFSFRVPSRTKNVLELSVWDEDKWHDDDLVSIVLLDLSTVEVDSKVSRELVLDPENEDVLELMLDLRSSKEEPVFYPSNGILLAPPLLVVDVAMDENQKDEILKRRCLPTLILSGAYEEHVDMNKEKLQFHVNRDLEAALEITEGNVDEEVKKQDVSPSAVPLTPPLHSDKVSVPLDKDNVDLHLETQISPAELSVRLDSDVPHQEKEFLVKRRRVVARALQSLLGLRSAPSEDQVPVIAVVASGGGARACAATLGSLRGLKELGVLDAVTYITAVSGATWAVSRVYQEQDWCQNLPSIISEVREQMSKELTSAFSVDKLRYYHQEMEEKEAQGHLVSLVDIAGLIVEHLVYGQKNSSTLSDQQRALRNGQNPLPIYTAVNSIKDEDGHGSEAEWVEFTPFEVGLQKYSVFTRSENFGSEFFLGRLIKKLPEIQLPFLIGIWSSVFSYTLEVILKKLLGSQIKWAEDETIIHTIEEDSGSSALDTAVLSPDSGLSAVLSGFFQNRPILNQTQNFIRGLSLHQNYSQSNNFTTSTESHVDAFPNSLTPSEPNLSLIDSGLSIKIACPSVLRPERRADVIIVLSNGWDPGEPFKVLKMTAEFCQAHGLPFPRVDYTELEQQPLREMYVFEDPETPGAPIVLHLPLVNDTYRQYKAPGVSRETEAELAEGQVDVSSEDSPYTTSNLTYSTKDFDNLLQLTSYNVLNNRDTILNALRRALSR